MMTGREDDRALTVLLEELEDIRDMLESAGEPTRPLREHLSKRAAPAQTEQRGQRTSSRSIHPTCYWIRTSALRVMSQSNKRSIRYFPG